MLSIIRVSLSLFLCLLSVNSYSSAALNNHVMAISQSMSAFYMYSLSEGDERYKTDYEQRLLEAQSSLSQFKGEHSIIGNELQAKLDQLRPRLEFNYVEGAGLFVDIRSRTEFREYLNDAYVKYVELLRTEQLSASKLETIELNIEVLTARFFDVSSALFGSMSLSNSAAVINPEKMAKVLNYQFDQLQASDISENVKRNLRAVETKWRFIENNVINYEGEAAHLLVYYNKVQIHKLLNKSRSELAGI